MPHLHLLIVRHVADQDEVERHVAGHIAYLDRLHAAGVFLASGQTVPPELGGAMIAYGPEREEIEKIIEEDTFVQEGVSTYEVVTIEVRRSHPQFAELLEQLRAFAAPA